LPVEVAADSSRGNGWAEKKGSEAGLRGGVIRASVSGGRPPGGGAGAGSCNARDGRRFVGKRFSGLELPVPTRAGRRYLAGPMGKPEWLRFLAENRLRGRELSRSGEVRWLARSPSSFAN